MPTTPPLDAEYAAWPIWPSKAAAEAVLTTTPRSPSTGSVCIIAAAASRMTLKVPTRLTCTTWEKAASGSGPFLPTTLPGVPTPAQLTTTRSGARADAASTAACTAASSVTSVATNSARPPAATISSATAAPGDDGRSATHDGRAGPGEGAGGGGAQAAAAAGDQGGCCVDLHGVAPRDVGSTETAGTVLP